MGIDNIMYLSQVTFIYIALLTIQINTIIPLASFELYHYYVKSLTLIVFSLHLKQCVHREGFNHSYAIKWIKKIMIEKSLF